MKDILKKRSFLFLLILLFISSCSNIYYTYDEAKEAKTTESTLYNKIEVLKDSINNTCIKTLERSIASIIDSLKVFGVKSNKSINIKQLNQIADANNLIDYRLLQYSENNSKIVIEYFEKEADNEAIKKLLKSSGLTVRFKKPLMPNIGTNALVYGKHINIDLLKQLALILTRAGTNIELIRQFQQSQGRENLIQICYDSSDRNIYGIQDIVKYK